MFFTLRVNRKLTMLFIVSAMIILAVCTGAVNPAKAINIKSGIKLPVIMYHSMGDGINDAHALSKADVGISVDTAVDIAKESADIILLEKDLMVLEHGVVEGRKIFGNIIKYIKMTASSNFGNMLSVLAASAFLPFLPMQRIELCALKTDRKKILEMLQRRGVVEVNDGSQADDVFRKKDTAPAQAVLKKGVAVSQEALEILNRYAPESKSLFATLEGRTITTVENYDSFAEQKESVLQLAYHLGSLAGEVEESRSEIPKLTIQTEALAPCFNSGNAGKYSLYYNEARRK